MFAFPGTPSTSAVRPPMFAGPMVRHSRRANALSKVGLVSAAGAGLSSGLGEGVAEGSCADTVAALKLRRKAIRPKPKTRLKRNIQFLLNSEITTTTDGAESLSLKLRNEFSNHGEQKGHSPSVPLLLTALEMSQLT